VNLFSTYGRVGRAYFFWHTLVATVVFLVLLSLSFFIKDTYGNGSEIIAVIANLFFVVSVAAYAYTETCVSVRRLHDLNRPGSHVFSLNPFHDIYLSFDQLFEKGTDGPN